MQKGHNTDLLTAMPISTEGPSGPRLHPLPNVAAAAHAFPIAAPVRSGLPPSNSRTCVGTPPNGNSSLNTARMTETAHPPKTGSKTRAMPGSEKCSPPSSPPPSESAVVYPHTRN
mmetsp:Transcript_39698/g.92967  ORF Transcript_39698/g.92967 Transcript_39698/m.92967 type:complete len:115 (+) Transcript_39698:1787-2131(+)